jgi:tRNA threonylcarbamoyladenosine biosynthesis protein TsaB
MARLLALDTTTARGSLALLADDAVEAEMRVVSDAHSRWVMDGVRLLLASRDVEASGIDVFAVTLGPGSFTGVRVGLSTIQGLALATGRPCVGLSSLEVLASLAPPGAGTVVAVVDAFRNEVFGAAYGPGGARTEPRACGIEALVAGLPGPLTLVGDGLARHAASVRAARPEARMPEIDLFLAPALGRLAWARHRAGDSLPPESLRPLYLRGADIRPSRPAVP